MKGLVVLKNRSQTIVEDLNNKQQYNVELKGSLRNQEISLCVGDYIEFELISNTYLITNIYPRKNLLLRPKIANVDKVYIVQSTKQPDFNELLIDKMIMFYKSCNIDTGIIYTKSDIFINQKISNSLKNYKLFGYEVLDANNNDDLIQLKNNIKDKIVCFVGNSGVGKSTLINKIDNQLNIKTQETSKALNRGKHTTTVTTIYNFASGKIVDSPGFSTITINLDKKDIAYLFFQSDKYHINCKFSDCIHFNELGCGVKELLKKDGIIQWRYDNYLKIIK